MKQTWWKHREDAARAASQASVLWPGKLVQVVEEDGLFSYTVIEPEPPAAEDILDEARRITMQDRGRDYGHPLDNFTQIAELWTAYLMRKLKPGEAITYRDTAWMAILMKASRDSNTSKRDNLVDTAGYARCAQVAEDEAKRREEK